MFEDTNHVIDTNVKSFPNDLSRRAFFFDCVCSKNLKFPSVMDTDS